MLTGGGGGATLPSRVIVQKLSEPLQSLFGVGQLPCIDRDAAVGGVGRP